MTRAASAVLQVLAVALASGTSYRSRGRIDYRAKSFHCPSEGFFPDPFDCSTFYRCVNWNSNVFFRDYGAPPLLAAFRFSCSEGTVFDPDSNGCNDAYATSRRECGGRAAGESAMNGNHEYPFNYPGAGSGGGANAYPNESENQIYPEVDPPESTPHCPSEGFFPVPGDCNQFIRCADDGKGGYKKFTFRCGDGTVWDQKNFVCNYPYAVPGCERNGQRPQGNYPAPYPEQEPNGPGYPQEGHTPGVFPQQGNRPEESGYPQQGGYPSQTSSPQLEQGNQAYPEHYPGYPGQENVPEQQGNYPDPVNRPPYYPQGGYPTPKPSYPEQYPAYPEQTEASSPHEEYPEQGGYQPVNGGSIAPPGNPNECQSDGFFGVPGDCTKFFRCVQNSKGGYKRYDFVCGPGTVWDQESTTCNHPWAVANKDCSSAMTTEATTDTMPSTTAQQETTASQSWNQEATSSLMNSTHSSSSSTSSQDSSTTSSSSSSSVSQSLQSTSQPSQSTSNQLTSQQGQNQQAGQMTTPMRPEYKPSTTRPQTTNHPTTPLGSRPCQPQKNMTIKCEKAGFYPVPGDCKKFYRCVDWDGDKGERFSVYYFECGEGTIWDPALETCNHEESVYPPRDCSGQESKPEETNQTTEKNIGTTDVTESTPPEESETTAHEDQRPTAGATTEALSSTDETEQTTTPSDLQTQTTTTPGPENPETTNPTEPADEDNQTYPTDTGDDQDQSSADCPVLGEDQVLFVCPTGFRRHPKDCNLFYQCTISKDGDVNVMTLSCKNDTVYDERNIQCLPPDETDPCPSKSARVRRQTTDEATSAVPIPAWKALCPKEGHFPYDCKRFFRCQKDKKGRLQGYLYQCPEKHFFSDSSGRCERSSKRKCSKSLPYVSALNLKWMARKVPIDYFDVR